jgi:hypothetical protein
MPDQPDDPVHYDMKIPPEPQDAPLNKQRAEQGSDEAASESSHGNEKGDDRSANPRRSSSSGK